MVNLWVFGVSGKSEMVRSSLRGGSDPDLMTHALAGGRMLLNCFIIDDQLLRSDDFKVLCPQSLTSYNHP